MPGIAQMTEVTMATAVPRVMSSAGLSRRTASLSIVASSILARAGIMRQAGACARP